MNGLLFLATISLLVVVQVRTVLKALTSITRSPLMDWAGVREGM